MIEQSGYLVSASYVKPGKTKAGADREAAIAVNVCYGGKLEDRPEFIWLSPADEHSSVLELKKYQKVLVLGRLSNGRFYVEHLEAAA